MTMRCARWYPSSIRPRAAGSSISCTRTGPDRSTSGGIGGVWAIRCSGTTGSTSNYANGEYGTEHRVMHRITPLGDIPVGPGQW